MRQNRSKYSLQKILTQSERFHKLIFRLFKNHYLFKHDM